jgi:hypothetical protein
MNAAPTSPPAVEILREREHLTSAMIRSIDDKIRRLAEARAERVAALNRIRSELARRQTSPVVSEKHVDPVR